MLGSFKGDEEIKQMEDERKGGRGGGREKKREGERGIGERERERENPYCCLLPVFVLLFVSFAQLCPCNYSQ